MVSQRFGILGLMATIIMILINSAESRAVNVPGSRTTTYVTHFTFLQKLGNPCGVTREILEAPPSALEQRILDREFLEAMMIALDLAFDKLGELEEADPTLPECNGLSLHSLPETPSFTNLNVGELYRQIYESGIHLAAHLHIMSLDRQVLHGKTNLRDDQVEEARAFLPGTNLRCGNESETVAGLIQEMATKVEDILCTLTIGSTHEQRSTFRPAYNKLLKTPIFRYHSSCSLLETRDCLVVRETRNVLINIKNKFINLSRGFDFSQINRMREAEDGTNDNSIKK